MVFQIAVRLDVDLDGVGVWIAVKSNKVGGAALVRERDRSGSLSDTESGSEAKENAGGEHAGLLARGLYERKLF